MEKSALPNFFRPAFRALQMGPAAEMRIGQIVGDSKEPVRKLF